jgi:sarcosine oxidase
MTADYEVVVVGLGAVGSSAAYHLAKKGCAVLGLDHFHPPHSFGSSHGLSRIIREAYFEHPLYVPLVQRAYHLWQELERESGRTLFRQTGGLMIGPPDGVIVTGATRSAQQHHLPHRLLTATEIHNEFPALQPAEQMVGVWEPRAGILFPELAIESHLELAARAGAELRFETEMLRWEPKGDGIQIHTATDSISAKQVLFSAGAWMSWLVPELRSVLSVERQVQFWFEPKSNPEIFRPDRCPIYIVENATGRFFYGFPDLGDGVKLGVHHQGAPAEPSSLNREIEPEEIEVARNLLAQFLPQAAGALRKSAVCMYTNTPDEHFWLDRHPNISQALVVSACSGHGFKFSSVVGEIAAALLMGDTCPFDLSPFKARLAEPSTLVAD